MRHSVALAALLAVAGCAPLAYEAPRPRRSVQRSDLDFGHSVENRTLYASVYGRGDRTVLLIGAIHGDEPGSHELVREVETWIAADPSRLDPRLRLVVATPINPDGLAAGTRRNARGIDLNRNFPARNFRPSRVRGARPLSEPESRFVRDLLERFEPSLVVTVHQPRRSVNYDGPARSIAAAMAHANGYRVEASVGYPTPGSLGSWVGIDRGIPIITLELPRRPPPGKSFFDVNRSAILKAFQIMASSDEAG